MSAFHNYWCSGCDLEGSSTCTWGDFFYQIGTYRFSIPRRAGVCYNCESITAVEILPDQTALHKKVKQIKGKSAPTGYLAEQIELASLLEKRESQPRCLECGSHNFQVIPKIDVGPGRLTLNTPRKTNLIHKKCGGKIYVRQPLLHIDGHDRKERFYTKEGIEVTYQTHPIFKF
ncbi:hypothetical protein [Fodinibius halophilus]|uniref:Uncharacterized protein n=1 Tax=Fodinibius halophilus TaxID=1736908 RepID=A0A6M1TDX9_9BACT|nr:hypothetical protein [Fodinibius halophilus]NGP88974.1 hypothetical protein [Fodinibius halophilus]